MGPGASFGAWPVLENVFLSEPELKEVAEAVT